MGIRELKHAAQLREWSVRIAECRSSGMSVREWCEARGIISLQRSQQGVQIRRGNSFLHFKLIQNRLQQIRFRYGILQFLPYPSILTNFTQTVKVKPVFECATRLQSDHTGYVPSYRLDFGG